MKILCASLACLLLSACAVEPLPPRVAPPTPVKPAPPATPIPTPPAVLPNLQPVAWSALPGWADTALAKSWVAFLQGCTTLQKQSAWNAVCNDARAMTQTDDASLRRFFETRFQPYRTRNDDGSDSGLITGYYEPLIHGSRTRTERARYPIYGVPDDLVTVDLASVYPELKSLRLRGRLVGNKLLPYAARSEIEAAPPQARVLAWADDPVELFFLQIQGSGQVEFADGSRLRLGYADQNGYPYKSIGKLLVERGELTLDQASMQGIKQWGQAHPDKLPALLAANPSYVFFRELPDGLSGPLGALGIPVTPRRTLAVDPRYIPLGAPVFLATTLPGNPAPFNRLMFAQDTGGAIRGGVRADFFCGFGDAAGELAGKMKQPGRLWVLLPIDFPLGVGRN